MRLCQISLLTFDKLLCNKEERQDRITERSHKIGDLALLCGNLFEHDFPKNG